MATYTLPYKHILGTFEEGNLTESMQAVMPGFRLYNESLIFNKAMEGRLRKVTGSDEVHIAPLIRELLRKDLCHRIPEIPEPWFWIAFSRLLWNFELMPDPYYEVKWWHWNESRGKMQCVNQWGCQNSGKSYFNGRFPAVQLVVWDADCNGFISGPYKIHTADKTWKEVDKAISQLQSRGINTEEAFSVKITKTANEVIAHGKSGSGFVKFVASQDASSIQGGKSDKHTENGRIGISLLEVDEFIENPNTDLDAAFGNFRSNFNSYTLFSCNPKPEKISAPSLASFSEPIGVQKRNLRKTKDFRWKTRKGLVVRFSWLNNPNKILGRTEFTHLLEEKRAAVQALEDDHIRAAQLDAWGFGAEGANTLTDAARQHAAGVFEKDFFYEKQPHLQILAIDPAFGGEDPAVFTHLKVATVVHGGEPRTRFVGAEQGTISGIDRDFIADADFIRKVERIIRYRHEKGDTNTEWLQDMRAGSQVGAMAQGAVEGATLAIEKGIPFDCVTFDASQRADCADWMFKVFGRKQFVWYYEGSRRLIEEEGKDWFRWPYRTKDNKRGESDYEKWSDYCSRTITMIWAFGCELINQGFLIEGDTVQRGLNELGAREVAVSQGGKMDIWSKTDIKRGMFQGKKIPKMASPAWGETLAMALYFGTRFKHAINLGDMPELSMHRGAAQTDYDEWLDLHSAY